MKTSNRICARSQGSSLVMKVLCIVVALGLVLAFMPVSSFAEVETSAEPTPAEPAAQAPSVELSFLDAANQTPSSAAVSGKTATQVQASASDIAKSAAKTTPLASSTVIAADQLPVTTTDLVGDAVPVELSVSGLSGIAPMDEDQSQTFSFSLPAQYDAAYQGTYGTVKYAVNSMAGVAPQYFDISQNSAYDATTHTYTINNTIGGAQVQNVTLQVTWNDAAWKVSLGDQAPPLQNGQPCFLGGPAAYTVHYDAPSFSLSLPEKYDANFQSKYGKVEYSTDGGLSYAALGSNMTETALPPNPQGNVTYKYSFATQPASVMLKISWDENFWMVQLSPSDVQPTNGIGMAVAMTDYFLQFDEPFYTVVWSYDQTAFGPDSLVTNGTVAIGSGPGIVGQADDLGGYYIIKPGTQVTVTLKPNYGYQFLKGSLNGTAVVAGTEVSTFTFTMPKAQLHLAALFDSSEDVVNIAAQSVVSGSLSGGAGVIDSGNLALSVQNATPTEAERTSMLEALTEAGVGAPTTQLDLALNLSQVVNKGAEGAAWENAQTDLAAPVTIDLKLDTALVNADAAYNVVRQHNGAYDVLPATMDAATGTLSFQTDRFSEYSIAVTPKAKESKDSATKASTTTKVQTATAQRLAKTGDERAILIGSLAAVAAAAGMVIACGIAKRRRNN